MLELTQVLSYFNSEITAMFRELKREDSIGTVFMIFLFSTIYGIIHALGPGHGKLLVASYLISREYSYKKAFKLGYMISGIHALSALSITLIIYFILEATITRSFQDATAVTTNASGVLIILIGFYMLYEKFAKEEEDNTHLLNSNKKDFTIALSAGIVPCPGVMTITLFSIIISKVYVGVISAILMSLGMGLTISVAGIFATKVQNISKGQNENNKVADILGILGTLGIILLGILLLLK
jgi:nickel/cobalt exporter